MNCNECGGNLKKLGITDDNMVLYQCLDCGKKIKMAMPSQKKSVETIKEKPVPPKYRVMTFSEYIGYSLFYLIPIIGWVFMIMDACDKKYLSRMQFARFYIIPTLVLTAIAGVFIHLWYF